MSRRHLALLALLAVMLLLTCFSAAAAFWLWRQWPGSIQTTAVSRATVSITAPSPVPAGPTPTPPSAAATPVPSPLPRSGEGGQASPLPLTTEQLLLQTDIPQRDQRLLAMRLKNNGQEIPLVVREIPLQYSLDQADSFWVTDNQETPPRQFQVSATLQYITPHSYWWVQDGFTVNKTGLKKSAEQFENHTYPTNREFFGSEWTPGVDNDARVHIFMGDVPGVAGYFSASNSYSVLAEPFSNEREMFFVNLRAMTPGNDYFDSVLAHEFQHMIHWRQDRNEDTWVNEGMSELATFLNGYGSSNFVSAYVNSPDTQLTGWAGTPGDALANYGGSFLFMRYFLQRFGEETTRAVIASPHNGLAGFDAALAEHGRAERFNDVFADFLVANYLNDPAAGDGRWGYADMPAAAVAAETYRRYPVELTTTVNQYGADYYELTGNGPITLDFSGITQVPVVDNTAHSGQYQWYSLRGDDSNSRLTRPVDLRGVSTATLNFWTWYDIEADWDYGYVEISTNNGRTWDVLQTPHSATDNPSGNAYGPGYTGQSGSSDGPAWVEESLDISAYVGQEVLLRFEYVTDDAVNRSGWTVDDISIPEIDFFDDVETGPGAWQAEGFVRIDNILPQKFLVQVLKIGDSVEIEQALLDSANRGQLAVPGLGQTVDRVVLIVSGLTPVTSQPAQYSLTITN